MNKSAIQLHNYQFEKLNLNWQNGVKKEHPQITISFNYEVFRKENNPYHFRLDFYVSIQPREGQAGLAAETKILGFFSFPKGSKEADMERLIRINGCSILYSTLRGHLSSLSSNFPVERLILPTIVMADVVADIERKKEAAIKSGK